MPQLISIARLEETLEALSQATLVNALPSIHVVQRMVADALLAQPQGERLARLGKSDIVETLLAKATAIIATDAAYSLLTTDHRREEFLEAHLRVALVGWLEGKVNCSSELRALQAARRTLYR